MYGSTARAILGGGAYSVKAVAFDGTNDYLSRGANLTGLLNSKTFTFSGWFKFSSSGNSQTLLCSKGSSDSYLQVSRLGSGGDTGKLRFVGVGTGSVTRLDVMTEDTIDTGTWHHIIASFDLSDTNKRFVLIDTNEASLTVTTYTNAVLNFTSATEFFIGTAESGSPQLYADVGDLWFNTEYLDLSSSAVYGKFISTTSGKPKDLGATGELPTGTSPLLYLSRRNSTASSFATNKGTGGGLTVTGALTNSTTSPSS